MTRSTYHFTFEKHVPMDAVEDALVLALVAGDALALKPRRTRPSHRIDDAQRTCVIDATSQHGVAVLRVFIAFVLGMFGLRAFRVVTGDDIAEPRTHGRRGGPPRCRCGRSGGRR